MVLGSYLQAKNVLRDRANKLFQKLPRVVPSLVHIQMNASLFFIKTRLAAISFPMHMDEWV